MPGNERASFKANTSNNKNASENAKAVVIPHSKAMAKPPTTSLAEERKFGRQLSTNNNEAAGATITLQVMPDIKEKPNVS